MSEQIAIRRVQPGDVPALSDIAAVAWAPLFACWRRILGDEIFDAAFSDWEQTKRRQVARACDPDDPAIVLVAECGGRVAGFASFCVNDTTRIGEIGLNAVSPDLQGRGIGRAMYERIFDEMRARGMRIAKVFTGADEAHAPARRAYQKAGFSVSLSSVEYYRKL